MENLDSKWTVESTDLNEFKSDYIENDSEDAELALNSPDASGGSGDEKSDENIPKNELESSLNRSKNVALAKKRLQAYTNKPHVKNISAKHDKNEENEKFDKNSMKKSKKDYPDDRAKAVIQEIEELKKKEAKVAQEIQEEQLKNDLITREAIAAAIKNIKNLASMARGRSRSLSSERDRQFKKREIKSRNYRRTESYDKRSISPEDRNRKRRRSTSTKKNYPKNWIEYSEEKLTTVKDEELKSKLFSQKTSSNIELCRKLYNFDTPAPFLEPFKYSTETETREVPFSHFRITKSHPKITFSINFQKNKESFLSRQQLFQIIPNGRRQLIEKLLNTSGKSHSTAKPLQTRSWYSRMWRKKDAECKVLENSVGLSFLQNYSDEEEEVDNEEVVICSSTKSNPKKEEPNMSLSDIKEIQEKLVAKDESDNDKITLNEKIERATDEDKLKIEELNIELKLEKEFIEGEAESNTDGIEYGEEKNEECEPGEIIDDSEKEYTPEKELLTYKMLKKEEIMKTKKAIKMLEKELAKRNEISLEENSNKKDKSKHSKDNLTSDSKENRKKIKKKKKKLKKTEESSESDSDEERHSKNKKKKKVKPKRKVISEDEQCSEDEKKVKKSRKKDKKKEKPKKRSSKKDISSKEVKSKTKDDMSIIEDTKRDDKKKKKKISVEDDTSDQKEERDSREKIKKRKTKKKRDESQTSSSSDESDDEKDKKDISKSKKDKHDIDLENIVSQTIRKNEVIKKSEAIREELRLEKETRIYENSPGAKIFEYTDLRQKLVAKSSKLKEQKSKEKIDDEIDLKNKPNEVKSSDDQTDLRWQFLENKRKRREEELEDFPLEKDTFINSPTKGKESNTPDTDEYLGHWEKDSDAVWESEEEQPPKPKEKLNSSWESDEETFERSRVNAGIRSFKDSLDLEIPLNIKPFKRRPEPNIDPDTELEILKIEGKNLSEERRRLEIEKFKVKQLELRVIREIEIKAREQKTFDAFEKKLEENYEQTPPRNSQRTSEKIRSITKEIETRKIEKDLSKTIPESIQYKRERPEKHIVIDLDKIQERAKMEISKPRRDRWDQKIAASSTPIKNVVDLTGIATPDKSNDRDDVVLISSSTEVKETSAVLENEYEQFMKAVNSNVSEKKEKNSVDVVTRPTKPLVVSPKDISFIPMPNEVKPVPVPSPKLDVDKISNPLINLSLSANITLDITSKIDSPNRKTLNILSSPLPTSQTAPVSKAEAIVSSSTLDIKPRVIKTDQAQEKLTNIQSIRKLEMPSVDFHIGSPVNKKVTVANVIEEKMDRTETNKPFIFGGMTLPTKKSLLDNSNLRLGDSDEEETINKPNKMRPLDDIKKENLFEEVLVPKIERVIENQPQEKGPAETVLGDQGLRRMRSRSPQLSRNVDIKQPRKEFSPKRATSNRHPSPLRSRRNESPVRRRSSPGRRNLSPRRSPRRRSPGRRSPDRKSPNRSRRSPGRRSPGRKSPARRSPAGKRRYSSRRSNSPSHRRRRGSLSPRRRSPRRSISPRASSAKRPRSRSPDKPHGSWKSPERDRRSRVSVASPLERLKRSVADSTISDDLLPQPSHNPEEYTDSPIPPFYDGTMKMPETPMTVPLELNYMKEPPKTISTTYCSYNYDQDNHYAQMNQYMNPIKNDSALENVFKSNQTNKNQHSFVQIGNMVQIVPRDLDIKTEIGESNNSQRRKTESLTVTHQEKSQIVQVGNIVRIVPTEFSPDMIKPPAPPPKPSIPQLPKLPLPQPPKPVLPQPSKSSLPQPSKPAVLSQLVKPPLLPPPPPEQEETLRNEVSPSFPTMQEKQSAEEAMKIKIAARKAEREQRRQEKEKKRLEKEKRRKEREIKRQIKMKHRTENMIKRALQLEVAAMAEDETAVDETPIQWPPVTVVSGVSHVGKGILIKGGFSTTNSTKADKVVKFADGVRPGEGTSPSGGEELSSPPPKKVLPKEKRYTKTKLKSKNQKKKVKVKIIKKSAAIPPSELDVDDDDDENLPPPSPPLGSPPPHLFPPRVKSTMINNIHPSFVLAVQTAPPPPPPPVAGVVASQQSNQFAQQQLQLPQQQLYTPAIGLLMAPPPPPPHHHHPGPPPPPHHHPGAPPPPHHHPGAPPHHHPHGPPHHGPPMPPHLGPPMPPHHGPPLPPGPPGHHLRPPPGPPGPHHRPPYHY